MIPEILPEPYKIQKRLRSMLKFYEYYNTSLEKNIKFVSKKYNDKNKYFQVCKIYKILQQYENFVKVLKYDDENNTIFMEYIKNSCRYMNFFQKLDNLEKKYTYLSNQITKIFQVLSNNKIFPAFDMCLRNNAMITDDYLIKVIDFENWWVINESNKMLITNAIKYYFKLNNKLFNFMGPMDMSDINYYWGEVLKRLEKNYHDHLNQSLLEFKRYN